MTDLSKLLILLATVLVGLQGSVSTWGLDQLHESIVGAVFIFLSLVVSSFKQVADARTDNRSLYVTGLIAAVSILGGALDFTKVLPLSESAAHITRVGISTLILLLNATSQVVFPQTAITPPSQSKP